MAVFFVRPLCLSIYGLCLLLMGYSMDLSAQTSRPVEHRLVTAADVNSRAVENQQTEEARRKQWNLSKTEWR